LLGHISVRTNPIQSYDGYRCLAVGGEARLPPAIATACES
jgi:hypothetical protein